MDGGVTDPGATGGGARAAVLARLWGAYGREPLDGVLGRRDDGGDRLLTLSDGRIARGPALAPFDRPPTGFAIDVDGVSISDPGELLAAISPTSAARDRFRAELDNSVANLAIARAAPQPADALCLRDLAGRADALPYLEQSIVDGHPLHPLCRTRMGMSADEVRRYGPEQRGTIDLDIIAVPPERWLTTGAGLPPLLPMHPWQREHVLPAHPYLRRTGDRIAARPLMSLRTVALVDDPAWHLKTAVDVQMTSAVRIVSPAAIHNGPLVSQLLAALTYGEPIGVLAETAAGAVLVDGEPSRSLAVVRRAAPVLAPTEIAVPFGVLAATSPATGRPFITEAIGDGDPAAFFATLIGVALPPLLRLLRLGVALEAHGQNTLVVLRDLHPVRILYRDMGGVRISPHRLRAAGIDAPALRGDLTSDDPVELRTKLAASFLTTVVSELVATLGREYGIGPNPLWGSVAKILRAARTGEEAAMLNMALPMKAMTAMRLATQPLEDIWTPVPNPMADM